MTTSTLFLSAVTIVAITGTTLVSLNYNKNHHHVESDDSFDKTNSIAYNESNDIDSNTNYHISPKFPQKNINQNELSMSSHDKPIVKRSSGESFEYDISDRNVSMIDEKRREKVKEVALQKSN